MRALARVSAAVLLLAACGGSATSSRTCALPAPVSGRATTYAGTSAGACMFPAGLALYAAVGPATFDGSAACGACLEVTGPAATVTLEVTDLCPECPAGALDLSPGAWDAATGGAPAGVAPVTWRLVPCPGAGPVRFVAGAGVNPWYASVVVQDHRYPIASVELLPSGAAGWLPLARDGANQWIGTAGGAGFATPLRFRATDVFGSTTSTDVPMTALAPGAEATAPQLGDACGR
ncbi:MAG TPA: expansin EXLX1 family cellulose-binding protein [Anaeromyxobacter sp.]